MENRKEEHIIALRQLQANFHANAIISFIAFAMLLSGWEPFGIGVEVLIITAVLTFIHANVSRGPLNVFKKLVDEQGENKRGAA